MSTAPQRPPHAGAVRARARVARRALFLSRVGEAVHLGAAAALVALASILVEGGRTDRLGSAAVALLCFALVALTWLLEHRRTARQVAERLDRSLGADGEFLTAWEQDGDRRGGPLSEVLVERAARHVPGRVAARAALPKSWPILATPFLAGALLASLAGRPDPADLARQAGRSRLASDLGRLAGEESVEALSAEEQRRLRELVRSARALAAGEPDGDESTELAEELRALESSLPAGSELAEGLGELAGRLAAEDRPRGEDPSSATGTGDGLASGAPGGTGGPPLAPGETDGTMVPLDPRPGASASTRRASEGAWVDPGALPPDLARILDDWDADPPGDSRR